VSRRARLALGWVFVLALAAWSTRATLARARTHPERAALPEHASLPEPASLSVRLLGPFAPLAASIQWVRVDLALRDGREELAYARSELALALDPTATQGWIFLAHHLVFDRASLERELDPRIRRHWIQAGLALLERGEAACSDPAELVFDRGLILTYLASLEPADRVWPETGAEAWQLAAAAFERSAELGHPLAAEAATEAGKHTGH